MLTSCEPGSPRRGTSTLSDGATPNRIVSATPIARGLPTARHRSGALLDGAIAVTAFGATLTLLAHGLGSGTTASRHLDAVGVLLGACASLPLPAWRRHALSVFAATTVASAALNLLGYPGGPPVGPTVALYLLASSRDAAHPWTRETTAIVVGLFSFHFAAFAIGHSTMPETELAIGAQVDTKVLILTTFEQDDYIFGGLEAGASGFLLKRTRPEDLIAAVHTIAAGESLLSPSVTKRVIDRMAAETPPQPVDPSADELTPREREVVQLIARGLSNGEIATTLVIEESTVRTHVKRILMKLRLRDRVQAVICAYEHGRVG